ncbi:TPA: site-specific integrase [Pseudomonas aeruginosa]|uniref:site-specific integrase n=1 Tax=Pseudomonas aeruginosa TaxID=287 RepID=UPI000FC436BF|nr:site-specific integrase [Pseudomonas aeruginosa]RUB64922.1 site-specific integrase [Pseudomonas aeruginosa]HCE7310540.1 site-specific integrase [Pseudomonas aeruginosa]HCE9778026.1 site-specific integrase [Pseudomonas aeruginosa]HCF1839943.1 site-specific integrase [Pseudomonas aeruginosa]
MGKIRARADNEKLFFDFTYLDQRCREQTTLPDTPANRNKLEKILERIEAEITLGCFDYATYFPQSSKVQEISRLQAGCASLKTPLFKDFAELWFEEMRVEWRDTHAKTVRLTLDKHLLPEFGKKEVSAITKAELLSFRSALGKVPGQKGQSLTATRINHIMTPLRMILSEAADRFEFTSPYLNIKSLKVPKTDVEPFTLDEVLQILSTVREDFRNYYTVRFFTGMRTAEVDGLQWKYVDFQRRQILIRETWVGGKLDYTKNDGSQREIDMSEPVYQALLGQREKTGSGQFVFSTREGTPHAYRNINDRVWYPLLRHLGLRRRRPYQTRHTAATLWLAAGENPEWIARQMGHTTTEMLFRVYSRYVPNLTRRDGSAFDNLIKANLKA